MNPGNFQGMGMSQMGMQMGQPQMGMNQSQIGQHQMGQAQMGQPQMGQMQMGHPQMAQISQPQMFNTTSQQQQILSYLRGQKIPMGWQQTYRIENRLAFIFQIVTHLNLLRVESQTNTLNIAIEFEKKEFENSPDQMTYEGKCREKLQELTEARQRKQRMQQNQVAHNPQMNVGQQQMPNNSMFTSQPQFQQSHGFSQMQQPMQNQNMAIHQQQQAQQQAQMQMRNGMGGQPTFGNGQTASNPTQQAPHGNNFQFTQQDQQQIQQIAQNMVSNMTPQDRLQLQQTAASLPPQLKQSLAEKGTSLVPYVIKQKATQTFLQQRSRMAAQAGNQGAFPGASGVPHNTPNPQASNALQIQQTPQLNQAGNMDHILRQQQDALHHQQEGQVVVPANTGQRAGNSQRAPSRVQKTPQQPQQPAFANNRPMQAPNQTPQQSQHNWNNMQKPTPNMQQTPQMPQTHNFGQIPGPNPQSNPLQGQTNGLNNALRTPQLNRGMPTLNQPMNPQNQSQNVPSPNPVQQTPNPGQRPVQNSSNGPQRSMANGQQHPAPTTSMPPKAALPIAMQQHLASLKTEEDKKNFIIMMQRKQQLQRQQAANTNLTALAHQAQGRGQAPQSGTNAQVGLSQSTPATRVQAMPNSNLPQTNNVRPNQGPQQPDSQAAFRQPPFVLTDIQEQQMDNIGYPDNILNASSVLAQMPSHVKNWGQLKAWVAHNAQNLPPDSLSKLKQLQATHYHMSLPESKRSLASRGQPGNVPQQPPRPGQVPSAQAFPNVNTQQSMPQGQTPGQPNSSQFPQVQPPTMQEVQMFKASLPQANIMSDDQIRLSIMSKRRPGLANAGQNPQLIAQNQPAIQQQYANMLKAQQLEQTRNQGLQPGQMSQPQASQMLGQSKGPQWKTQQDRIQAEQQKRNQTGNKPPPQGVKRPSDDIVEVSDHQPGQQQSRQPPTPVATAPQPSVVNGKSGLTQDQLASLNRLSPAQINGLKPAQRAAFEAQRRNAVVQANQRGANSHQTLTAQSVQAHPQLSIGNDGNTGDSKIIRVRQLRDEVMRSMPPRKPVPMNPAEKGVIIQKLRESKNQFLRITQSLPVYLAVTQNEAKVKDVIRTHALLSAQVRDSDHNPVDNFTVTPEEFSRASNNLQRYWAEMSRIVQHMQKATQNKQAQQSQGNKTQPPAVPNPQQLSAANLQQQQEDLTRIRAASLHKNQSHNKPPAAPTTSHVPFPFGSQSPQGVPQIYVPKKNELTQDKLQLPVPKKQKKNQASNASSTPAQAKSTPGAHVSPPAKVDSPEAQRLPAGPAIKCPVTDCKHLVFGSKALLDKHSKDVHEVKDEQITDPLEYVLGGLRMALNLDENGQSKRTEENASQDPHQALASKPSASLQGTKGIKQEVATPASKTLTGLKTPQTKASTPTPSKEASQPKLPATIQDPWANSSVPQHWFSEVFRDVADTNRTLSGDFLASWLGMQPEPDLTSADDSPQSTDKNSPRKSDISTTDNIDITIVGEDGFLTENWFDIASDMNALEMAGLTNLDWDATVPAETAGSVGKRTEGDTSDEWLKVYAPEKYNEKMKLDKKAVR